MQLLVKELNKLYRQEPAFWQCDDESAGFEWIDFNDAENTVWSFLRKGGGSEIIVIVNATPVPRYAYRLGVSHDGKYEIIFNSDAGCFGGSGLYLPSAVEADHQHSHRFWNSIVIDLPPLSTVYLRFCSAELVPSS